MKYQYSVFTRHDPYPRMLVSMDPSTALREWSSSLSFYAFTIPLPGSTRYIVKTSIPIPSTSKDVVSHFFQHKLTTSLFETSWDYVMDIFVYPASQDDCFDMIAPEYMPSTGMQ